MGRTNHAVPSGATSSGASRPSGRRWLLAMPAAAGVVLIGTFLPWLRSGSVWRNSYEIWHSANRLGVVEGVAAETLRVAWFLLPLGAACLLVAVGCDRARPGALIALALALLAGVGATVALVAPLPSGAGPWVTAAGASLLAITAAGNLRGRSRRHT